MISQTQNLKTGSSEVIVNGKLLKIDSVPVINEEVIFIPLRFAFEIFSARVKWDKNTRTIEILTGELDFLEPEISVVYPRNKWKFMSLGYSWTIG